MDANRAPGLIPKSNLTQTGWGTGLAPATPGQDIYIGRWHDSAIDFYDGVIGHLFWFNRQLSLAELETLAPLVRQVAYLPSIQRRQRDGERGDADLDAQPRTPGGWLYAAASAAEPWRGHGDRQRSGTSVDFAAGPTRQVAPSD